jgi:hypothetical protein
VTLWCGQSLAMARQFDVPRAVITRFERWSERGDLGAHAASAPFAAEERRPRRSPYIPRRRCHRSARPLSAWRSFFIVAFASHPATAEAREEITNVERPRGDQQPGDLWVPPRLGYGEPYLLRRLQPQATRADHADARTDACAASSSRHGRPHVARSSRRHPTSAGAWTLRWAATRSVSVAFAIDCHDCEVPAYVAWPRPLTVANISMT